MSMSMENLESVALMVSEKRCLDMTDRRTDMAKSIGKTKEYRKQSPIFWGAWPAHSPTGWG